jgi:DNA-binding XRE family transcriptional regulator
MLVCATANASVRVSRVVATPWTPLRHMCPDLRKQCVQMFAFPHVSCTYFTTVTCVTGNCSGWLATLMEGHVPHVRSRSDLVALRQARGLTQLEVAERAGCSRATIGHLETGEMTMVASRIARLIARELGVPANVLFGMPGDASSRPRRRR